jgi:membrane protease YdiL (CAAX protease family)
MFVSQLLAALFAGPQPSAGVVPTALGFGLAVGFGGLGTLAARRVPPPADARLGLRSFAPAFLISIVLLLPLVVVVSELDNVTKALFPPAPEPAGAVADPLSLSTPLDLLQSAVLIVGIVPVVEEWFFRGVLQQGVVDRLGPVRGVGLTALLFALAHGGGTTAASWVSAGGGMLLFGLAFGALRIASGSLLPPVLLHMAVNACGVFGTALAARVPIAGFNAPGEHSPLPLVVGSVVASALGLAVCLRLGRRGRGASGGA